MTSTMLEVPEDVLTAIMRVVQWTRGSEAEGEVGPDEIIEVHSPVLEERLMEMGVLPGVHLVEGLLHQCDGGKHVSPV